MFAYFVRSELVLNSQRSPERSFIHVLSVQRQNSLDLLVHTSIKPASTSLHPLDVYYAIYDGFKLTNMKKSPDMPPYTSQLYVVLPGVQVDHVPTRDL